MEKSDLESYHNIVLDTNTTSNNHHHNATTLPIATTGNAYKTKSYSATSAGGGVGGGGSTVPMLPPAPATCQVCGLVLRIDSHITSMSDSMYKQLTNSYTSRLPSSESMTLVDSTASTHHHHHHQHRHTSSGGGSKNTAAASTSLGVKSMTASTAAVVPTTIVSDAVVSIDADMEASLSALIAVPMLEHSINDDVDDVDDNDDNDDDDDDDDEDRDNNDSSEDENGHRMSPPSTTETPKASTRTRTTTNNNSSSKTGRLVQQTFVPLFTNIDSSSSGNSNNNSKQRSFYMCPNATSLAESSGGGGGGNQIHGVAAGSAASVGLGVIGSSGGGGGGGGSASGNDLMTGWSARINATSALFDLMSSNTSIDHPLCEECADQLVNQLDAQCKLVEKEQADYAALMSRLGHQLSNEDEIAELESQLASLAADEQTLLAQLDEKEKREAALCAEREARLADEAALAQQEQALLLEYSNFKRQLVKLEERQESLDNQLRNASFHYQRLRNVNVLNAAFHIWHSGPFGTINFFRLGRLPGNQVFLFSSFVFIREFTDN